MSLEERKTLWRFLLCQALIYRLSCANYLKLLPWNMHVIYGWSHCRKRRDILYSAAVDREIWRQTDSKQNGRPIVWPSVCLTVRLFVSARREIAAAATAKTVTSRQPHHCTVSTYITTSMIFTFNVQLLDNCHDTASKMENFQTKSMHGSWWR